ncbi:MAG: leucine-rich repeat domain-containing protein [Propionibacteriaceae bacterium]|jgi:hypothetical protein|nr:leucine-rich repeat domain-containing protein [Propionibacteriaceae bacterium]
MGLVAGGIVGSAAVASASQSVITDAAFQTCLNEHLEMPSGTPLTPDSLALLTDWVSCNDRGITSLEGAKYLTNLDHLMVAGNNIHDLSPLSSLTTLTGLNASDNKFTSIQSLASLTGLTWLSLGHNSISDISPLAGLTNLTDLALIDMKISSISPLKNVKNLTKLDISGNNVSDLSPVSGMTSLTEFFAADNAITSISPLSSLSSAITLDLRNNTINDLAPAAKISGLQTLMIDNNNITSVAAFAGHPSITAFWASGNHITDLSPLPARIAQSYNDEHVTGTWQSYEPGFTNRDQTVSLNATVGTAAVPTVKNLSGGRTIIWFVSSGNATVASNNTTVTYHAPGTVTLTWSDRGERGPGSFSGSVTVTVAASGQAANQAPAPKPLYSGYVVQGGIEVLYNSLGGGSSYLRQPTSGEIASANGGVYQTFQGGIVYWSPTSSAHAVHGAVHGYYHALDSEWGTLGYPLTEERLELSDGTVSQEFQGGVIYWSPYYGAIHTQGAIRWLYSSLGGASGFLGFPTSGENVYTRGHEGVSQSFLGGVIYWSEASGAHTVHGGIRTRFDALSGVFGYLGFPTSQEIGAAKGGAFQHYQGGTIYWSEATGSQAVHGAIGGLYARRGGPASSLGYPVTEEIAMNGGVYQRFQGGTISWTPARDAWVS